MTRPTAPPAVAASTCTRTHFSDGMLSPEVAGRARVERRLPPSRSPTTTRPETRSGARAAAARRAARARAWGSSCRPRSRASSSTSSATTSIPTTDGRCRERPTAPAPSVSSARLTSRRSTAIWVARSIPPTSCGRAGPGRRRAGRTSRRWCARDMPRASTTRSAGSSAATARFIPRPAFHPDEATRVDPRRGYHARPSGRSFRRTAWSRTSPHPVCVASRFGHPQHGGATIRRGAGAPWRGSSTPGDRRVGLPRPRPRHGPRRARGVRLGVGRVSRRPPASPDELAA